MRSTPVSSKPSWAIGRPPGSKPCMPSLAAEPADDDDVRRISWLKEKLGPRRHRSLSKSSEPLDHLPPCPCCGGRSNDEDLFWRWRQSRAPPRRPHQPGASPGHSARSSAHLRATPPLRRMRQDSLFAKISATGLNVDRAPRNSASGHGLPTNNSTHNGPANSSAEPVSPTQASKTQNPHRPSPQPRGFVHGRFLVRLTASENLHRCTASLVKKRTPHRPAIAP